MRSRTLFSILSVLSALAILFVTNYAVAAAPTSRTWTKADYTQDCGNGRKGPSCFQARDIELTWSHPTQREDSSALTINEVSHYVISMSKDGGPARMIAVSKKTSFTLRHMPSGTYTFQISTFDTNKQQSAFSAEIQITI